MGYELKFLLSNLLSFIFYLLHFTIEAIKRSFVFNKVVKNIFFLNTNSWLSTVRKLYLVRELCIELIKIFYQHNSWLSTVRKLYLVRELS